MKDLWQIVFGILGSIGTAGAIILALSSWLGKIWAERMMAKESAKYREELERLTKQLERKNYVSKVRFDTEFSIYRELCALTGEMERAVYMLFPVIDHLPQDEESQKKVFAQRYERASLAYSDANRSLSKNSAFIPKDVFDLFDRIRNLCSIQVNLYPYSVRSGENKLDDQHENECWKRTLEIEDAYIGLQEKLRDYLGKLDVLDL